MSAVQMTLFIRMKCTADVSITVYSLNIVTINIDPFLSIGKQRFLYSLFKCICQEFECPAFLKCLIGLFSY